MITLALVPLGHSPLGVPLFDVEDAEEATPVYPLTQQRIAREHALRQQRRRPPPRPPRR